MSTFDQQLNVLLQNIVDSKRVVFFVGAGLSVSSGHRLWAQAAEYALSTARSRGLIREAEAYARAKLSSGQFYECFQILKSELSQATFDQLTVEAFSGSNQASDTHRRLVELDCRGIITTNFDECLLSACVEVRHSPPVTDLAYALASDEYFIVKAHGSIKSPRSMVLTSSDWPKVVDTRHLQNLLADVLGRGQLIFLGYGMNDPDFDIIWNQLLRERVFRAPALYLCRVDSLTPERAAQFKARNVQVVPFPDDGSYSYLPALLKSLKESWPIHSRTAQLQPTDDLAKDLDRYVLFCLHFSPSQESRLVLLTKALLLERFTTQAGQALSEQELNQHTAQVLGLESDTSAEVVRKALAELCTMQLVIADSFRYRVRDAVARDLNAKVQALRQKETDCLATLLQEQAAEIGASVSNTDKEHLSLLLDKVLLRAGREIAEFFLFSRRPTEEGFRIEEETSAFCTDRRLEAKDRLYRHVLKRLLFDPGEQYENLVFTRLQSYFIATAYLLNPTSERLLAEHVRDHHVYLDSSILLPALATGHPSNGAYRRLLHRSQALGMSLRVIEDMVNEVWANVRSALDAFQEFGNAAVSSLTDILQGYVELHGPGNGNVFLEGYLNQLRLDASLAPEEYMAGILSSQRRPISEEDVIHTLAERLGVTCERLLANEIDSGDLGRITDSIAFLRKQGNRFKTRRLCEHEARIFYLIHLRRQQTPRGHDRIWYITTDRFVGELQRLERVRYPLPVAYSPRYWFQYLDLIDFQSRGSRHFSRLQPILRFGVASGELGIEAIRVILQEQRQLLAQGIVSVRELAEAAVKEYHVRQAISEHDRKAGSSRVEDAPAAEAKQRVRDEIRKATVQYVAVRRQEIEDLKRQVERSREENAALEKKIAKRDYMIRTLRAQAKPRKKKR
jgi:hypothetical protein